MEARREADGIHLVVTDDEANALHEFLEQFYAGDGSVSDDVYDTLEEVLEGA